MGESNASATSTMLSQREVTTSDAFRAVVDFIFASRYGDRRGGPNIADFTIGNPQEMPLPGLVAAIREQAIPQNKDWYAYKTSEEVPQAFLAQNLLRHFERRDVRDPMRVAEKAQPGSVILAMLPDTGERYLTTPVFEGIAEDMDEGERAIFEVDAGISNAVAGTDNRETCP